ncbi:hypothetical protein G3M58_83040 [Streptomyces sp. SID7499]|uniref:Uncharacterized protein n=1 Tax=Streptomyces sp. SID7499 TaxID=2706086 RepID=A0A6G3XTF1_9ACTN|nr:hypothetical protein [Streptomyces sp. SID7499]
MAADWPAIKGDQRSLEDAKRRPLKRLGAAPREAAKKIDTTRWYERLFQIGIAEAGGSLGGGADGPLGGQADGPPGYPDGPPVLRRTQCADPAVAGGSSTWTPGSPASAV